MNEIQTQLFDGDTFDLKKDGPRLSTMLDKVYHLMKDGRWRTLSEIRKVTGGSEAGISARLRDLRKEKFQAKYPTIEVERRRRAGGLYEYRALI